MAEWRWLRSICAIMVLALSTSARAQTVEGDILRGQGAFAAGAGWYNLNTAKANAINVEAMRNYNQEVRSNYDRIYNYYLNREKKQAKSKEEAEKRAKEKIEQIQKSPTVDDIRSGEALNMLVLQLTNPDVKQKDWYAHAVALPDASVKDIAFDYYPNGMTAKDLSIRVCLSRVSKNIDWPIALTDNDFDDERKAYQQAVSQVKADVIKGRLERAELVALTTSLDGLLAKINKVHGQDKMGFLTAAKEFHAELKSATKLFDGTVVDYSSELLRETERYDVKTVGELLAFMLKYRLFFSKANSPRANVLYNNLYTSMKDQANQLNANLPMTVDGSKPLEPIPPTKSSVPPETSKPKGPQAGQVYMLENVSLGKFVFAQEGKRVVLKSKKAGADEAPYRFKLVATDDPNYFHLFHVGSQKYMFSDKRQAEVDCLLDVELNVENKRRNHFQFVETKNGCFQIKQWHTNKCVCADDNGETLKTKPFSEADRASRYEFRLIEAR